MRLHLATLACSTVMIAAAARADEVGSWSNDWTGNRAFLARLCATMVAPASLKGLPPAIWSKW